MTETTKAGDLVIIDDNGYLFCYRVTDPAIPVPPYPGPQWTEYLVEIDGEVWKGSVL